MDGDEGERAVSLHSYPWELRFDRPYDEQSPSTLIHPNGSLLCSQDRPFLNVAARLIVESYAERKAA